MGHGIWRGVAAVLLLLVVGGIGYAIGTHQGGPMVGPDGAAHMHYYGHWGGGGFHIFGFIFFFFLIVMLLRFVFSPWRHRGWGGPGYWGGGYWGGPWMRGGYWGGPMGPGGPGGPGNGAPDEWQAHLDEMHRRSHERMDAGSHGSSGSEPPASAQ
jgi:hypothetical protein